MIQILLSRSFALLFIFRKKLFHFIALGFFIFPSLLSGQDTLMVMQYNLLKYGVTDAGCTVVPASTKNSYLSPILSMVRPDIFGVNELGSSSLYAENILVNVLKPIDPAYERAAYTNNASSNIVNMLFYNSDKLVLYSQATINHSLRDINHYRLFYKDAYLAITQDTLYLDVIIVHLKAGTTAPDELEREDQVNTIFNYLDNLPNPGNTLLMGDFNLKSSSEAAYQELLTHSNLPTRFYDPINSPGTWNSNASFEAIHTQSTRSGALPDCGSSGGMDDRFDFIISTRSVIGDSDRVNFVPGSYTAYGNDANHYNLSINAAPANTAVSPIIANALYNNSDHLPVIVRLAVDGTTVGVEEEISVRDFSFYPNPCGSEINIQLSESIFPGEGFNFSIFDLTGKKVIFGSSKAKNFMISTSQLLPGMYLLEIGSKSQGFVIKKLIKR